MVAWAYPLYGRPDLLDYACALVTDHRRQGKGDDARAYVEVGVAHAGGDHANQDLVRSRILQVHLFKCKRRVFLMYDRCGGLHVSLPVTCRMSSRTVLR